jgi:hypothetical protein
MWRKLAETADEAAEIIEAHRARLCARPGGPFAP